MAQDECGLLRNSILKRMCFVILLLGRKALVGAGKTGGARINYRPGSGLADIPLGYREEGEALLQFKADFDPNPHALASWTPGSNCCGWEGVTCQERGLHVGRVMWLILEEGGSSNLVRKIAPEDGFVGASLGNLLFLETLILRGVYFNAPMPAYWSKLTSLTHLELSKNNFTGSFPPQLSALTLLQTLIVNSFPTWAQDYCIVVMGMEVVNVDLRGNSFHGPIPWCMSSWYSVRSLMLSNNIFTGHIPPDLGNLTNLVTLDLGENYFSGPIPFQLFLLPNLETLALVRNQLNGPIPSQFNSSSSLQGLDLRSNRLSGEIPASLGLLSKIELLILGENLIIGSIPRELGNLTNLRQLTLAGNQLSGSVPSELGYPQNLRLDLSNNFLTGSFPLLLCHTLLVDLSGNKLSTLPIVDVDNLLDPINTSNFHSLYLDRNHLASQVPAWLVFSLANLMFLSLSYNMFSGPFPLQSFLQHPNLLSLDLGFNSFSQNMLPAEILDPPSGLGYLALCKTGLSGTISANLLASTPEIFHLDLSHNELGGTVPPSICQQYHLHSLDLSFNKLTGLLPPCLDDPSKYSYLDVSHNNFS